MLSLRKQPTFGDATTGFPAKWRLRNERRNSILMTRHYPGLGSTSDWLNQISHAARAIRSTNQILVVTRHQYGISALVSHTLLDGETSGSVAKCRLFSQANQCFEGQCWCFTHTCRATNQVVFMLQKNVEEIRGYFYLPRQACSSASDVTPSCGVTPGKFIQSEVSVHAPFNNLICCKTVW